MTDRMEALMRQHAAAEMRLSELMKAPINKQTNEEISRVGLEIWDFEELILFERVTIGGIVL